MRAAGACLAGIAVALLAAPGAAPNGFAAAAPGQAVAFGAAFRAGCGAPAAENDEAPEIPVDLSELLSELVSERERVRLEAAACFRSRLDARAAESLMLACDGLAPPCRRAVIEILRSGGPWMPGVLRSLRRDPGVLGPVRTVITGALGQRPVDEDPPPLFAALRIFPEGLCIDFLGTWPGPVPLDGFLDQVNFAVRPAYALVLSPELADGAHAGGPPIVRSRPPDGPADMILDSVLQPKKLGIRLLETVALAAPEGSFCNDLSAGGQDFDEVLLDRILAVAADPAAGPNRSRAATRALAALDPPGFFEGYLREIRSAAQAGGGRAGGAAAEAVDYLISAGPCRRTAARLTRDCDLDTAAFLVGAWKAELPGARKTEIARLIQLLPTDLRDAALSAADAGAAAEVIFRGPTDPCAIIAALAGAETTPRAVEIERCLMVLGATGGDEALAPLLREGTLWAAGSAPRGAFEAAAAFGGGRCFDELVCRLRTSRISGSEAREMYSAARAIGLRLNRHLPADLGSGGGGLGEVLRAARLLDTDQAPAGGAEQGGAFEAAAAGELVRAIAKGGGEGMLAAGLLEFCPPARVAEVLIELAGFEKSDAPTGEVRAAAIGSVLRAAGQDPTAAAQLRLDLRNGLGERMDPILDRALKTLSAFEPNKAFWVEVRVE